MKKGNKGFTLIELLVVIAIIAILSTVVMAGLNSARSKARDARRLSDIKEIQSALNLYYDNCGGFPDITAATVIANPGDATHLGPATAVGCSEGSTFGSFMAVVPVNPLPGGADYTYCSSDPAVTPAACGGTNSKDGYMVTFNLEGTSGSLGSGPHTALVNGVI